MSISEEYLGLIALITSRIEIPKVSAIHLPIPVEDVEKPDEFGFVFLEDGSTGPFYTSLEDSLLELWKRFPDSKTMSIDIAELLNGFSTDSLASRALALGAFNALSHHVMQRAAYSPASEKGSASTGNSSPQTGDKVGMVGYFCPLIDKLLDKNIELVVLEKNPGRVELQPGLTLSENPHDLESCQHILCTASTLINGSLDEILSVTQNAQSFSLIGPSGSGLPDILFKHGIDAVGGIHFHDMDALHEALKNQESWGKAGKKYNLTADQYPGVEVLLEKCKDAY